MCRMAPSTPCCRRVETMISATFCMPASSSSPFGWSWRVSRLTEGSWKTSPDCMKANSGASFDFFFLPRSCMAAETTISGRAGPDSSGSGSGVGSGGTAATTRGSGVGTGSSPFSSLPRRRRRGSSSSSSEVAQAGSSSSRPRFFSRTSAPAMARPSRSSPEAASTTADASSSSSRARSAASSARISATAARCRSMASAIRWTDQLQADRMAAHVAPQTFWTFTSVATMSATTAPAPTTSAVPTGPMSVSARVQSSRPTNPPGAKLASPRPERKRWARVATDAVRTA